VSGYYHGAFVIGLILTGINEYNVHFIDLSSVFSQEEISVSTGRSYLAGLLSVAMAFSILLVVGVAVPGYADAGCRLAGINIATGEAGETVILDVEGTPEYQVVPLEEEGGIAIVLADCELMDGFQLPALDPEISISRIDYRLTLMAGTQSVELTIMMHPGTFHGYQVDTSEPGALTISLAPEVTPEPPETETPVVDEPGEVVEEVEVMWYGPREGDPDAIYRIDSINVEPFDGGEQIVITLDGPSEPDIRKFSYPNRVAFELEGGYLAEDVDEYLYTSRDGLITRVDILFSPQHLAGVFQLIITAPEMEDYETSVNGSTYTIRILEAGATPTVPEPPVMEPDTPIEPASSEITPEEEIVEPETITPTPEIQEESVPEEPAEMQEEPAVMQAVEEDIPDVMEDSESDSDFFEYPDVPISGEMTDAGGYNFPEAEPSFDPDHVSDAIVSLNVTAANFIDVMMILAEQAGVNFVLDAYWNIPPTGFIRESFRPPGGPYGGSGSGGFGGGSGFGPRDRSNVFGSVTMNLTEVPFDVAFGMLMQANNLRYTVFRYTEDMDPILFISSRERIEQELGLGTIQIYHLHYIDPGAALNFLSTMDLLPTTSGYGMWTYGGGNSGGSGGYGGGGGGGFGGGGGYSADAPSGLWDASIGNPVNGASLQSYGYASIGQPTPMQAFGGGGSGGTGGGSGGGGGFGGGGGGGAGGGGGGGYASTAKAGAIGIIATEETHDAIREALMQIDKPPKQIFVEATFITYDETNPDGRPTVYGLQNIGDWALEAGGDRFYGAFDVSGSEGLVFEILPKNQRMPFDDFRARFHYIFSERNARIISSPRVAVIDGFTATIDVTENRPFIVDGGVVIDQFGNPIPAPDIVTFVPTGTTLTITPYIDDFGNVTMDISPSNTQLLGEPQLINGNLVFGTANASVTTVLRMRDGETIIIGGLKIKNRDYETMRLPLLGDIPLIGALFGRTEINITESQLIILMTVHLVGS